MNAPRLFRLGVVVATMWWPWPARRLVYRRLLGWSFDEGASIGLSLIEVRRLHLGRMARIGHLNVVRQMAHVELSDGASIGQWNWITSAPELASGDGGFLHLGRESAITSRHYIDCSGGVRIGNFATIAGVRSVILSHQIDVERNQQTISPVEVGEYALVSSNVCLTPGSLVPRSCVVAMGAVVVGELDTEGGLYAGVPAALKRQGIESGKYFARTEGVVRPGARSIDTVHRRVEADQEALDQGG